MMDATSINTVLDQIANRLAVPTETIVRSYVVAGKFIMLPSLVMLAVSIGLLTTGWVLRRKSVDGCSYSFRGSCEMWSAFAFIVGIALGTVSVICFACSFSNWLLWLSDPQAYAVIEVMNTLAK